MDRNTYIAHTRFGMGIRAKDGDSLASPAEWLISQVQRPEPVSPYFADLPSSSANRNRIASARMTKDKMRVKEARKEMRDVFMDEMQARIRHAINTPLPFYERLVNFWSNHFTVSVKKGEVAPFAGAFEREAIRPNVTGSFKDMLLAVVQHPAMLLYLDNAQSLGPNSIAGRRGRGGLNENLAREIMELHTLGVNGGYTQQDVTSFAKVITGWTVERRDDSADSDSFNFVEQRHEPGEHTVLNRTYGQKGIEQGVKVLEDLAAHPATAKHIATKLARHFIGDSPSEASIQNIASAFSRSGGSLPTVYHALLSQQDAWLLGQIKIKNGYDLIVSSARLCGDSGEDGKWLLQSLRYLGDAPFMAGSPAGYPDVIRGVAGPEAVMRRIEWAQTAAQRIKPQTSFKTLADRAIGPIIGQDTWAILNETQDKTQGLALLLASPEFQRR